MPGYLPEDKERAIKDALLAAYCGAENMSLKAMQIMVKDDYIIPDNIMMSVVAKARQCPHGDKMNVGLDGEFIVTFCCLEENFDTELTALNEILRQFPRQIDRWKRVVGPAERGTGWVRVRSITRSMADLLRFIIW
tara:strand:+ start:185 stop:592 length:408 start_codon:yes stop_codon:yes gene_type:complete